MDALTLQDLLTLKILGDATVLAGSDCLAERRVDWVSVIEIPVEDFVRQDELVLTTAIGCGNDPVALCSFVEEVHGAGAAALAIAVGRHIEVVPESVGRVAESLHFPLLAIPWDVRFADISRRVYSEMALKTAEIGNAGGVVRPLLLQVAQDASLDKLIATLSLGLSVEVTFFDAGTGGWWGSSEITALCRTETKDILPHLVVPRGTGCGSVRLTRILVGGYELETLPICSEGRWLGTLVVQSDPQRPDLFGSHEPILRHLVALAYLEQESFAQESLQRSEDLAWKLATGQGTWDDVGSGVPGWESDGNSSYFAVVGALDNWDTVYQYNQTVFYEQTRSEWELDVIQTVRRALAKNAEREGFRVVTTFQRGEWIGFAFTHGSARREVINNILKAAHEGMNLRAFHGRLSWGVVQGAPEVEGFRQAYQNARTALEVGLRRQGPGDVYEYERISHEQVLSRFLGDDTVRSAVQATVGSLVDYDRQHGADLVNTLAVYLENRTNVSVTARMLHLHRQSLLYRLKKIEMLTGRSLDDADDLFLLEICGRLLKLKVGENRSSFGE